MELETSKVFTLFYYVAFNFMLGTLSLKNDLNPYSVLKVIDNETILCKIRLLPVKQRQILARRLLYLNNKCSFGI